VVEWPAIAARVLAFAGTLVLFGSSAFFYYGLAGPASDSSRRLAAWPRFLFGAAAAIALLGSALWLMSEAAALSGNPADALDRGAIWSVISGTRFGCIGAIRCAVLALILITLLANDRPGRRIWLMRSGVAAIIVASMAWTGHGNIDVGTPGWLHLTADALHLLAAGLWVGALVPLSVLATRVSARTDSASEHEFAYGLDRFSAIGVLTVAVLLLSGLLNTWYLAPPALWRSALSMLYARVLILKVSLFALMLGLAAVNRLRLVPNLQRAEHAAEGAIATRRTLCATLFAETALAILVLALVALLGTLEPPVSSN
jgi:copper resistance protein D